MVSPSSIHPHGRRSSWQGIVADSYEYECATHRHTPPDSERLPTATGELNSAVSARGNRTRAIRAGHVAMHTPTGDRTWHTRTSSTAEFVARISIRARSSISTTGKSTRLVLRAANRTLGRRSVRRRRTSRAARADLRGAWRAMRAAPRATLHAHHTSK